MSTIPQLSSLQKRLNELSLQKARYGISADPSIITEAQELDQVIAQMRLIDIHRANVDQLVQQVSKLGNHAPPYVTNQLMSERAEIVRLRQVCARLGHNVPVHELDDNAEVNVAPSRAVPDHTVRMNVRDKLDQIERILDEIRSIL